MMSTGTTFNSLKIATQLEQAGVPSGQAQAQALVLTEVLAAQDAHNADIYMSKTDLGQSLVGIQTELTKMDCEIHKITSTVNSRFEQMETKFHNRCEQLDRKIDSNFEKLDSKIDSNFEKLDNKIDSNFEKLDNKIDKLSVELKSTAEKLDNRIDKLSVEVKCGFERLDSKIDSRIAGVTADLKGWAISAGVLQFTLTAALLIKLIP